MERGSLTTSFWSSKKLGYCESVPVGGGDDRAKVFSVGTDLVVRPGPGGEPRNATHQSDIAAAVKAVTRQCKKHVVPAGRHRPGA